MSDALLLGSLFGLGAALSVGPIFVTIVHESITHGVAAGLRVVLGSASADVILMIPALAASWLIAGVDALGTPIAVVGAVYFGYLAIQAVREGRRLMLGQAPARTSIARLSFTKGVLGNLLNPLAWGFWLATGTPTMLRVYQGAGVAGLSAFTVAWFGVAMGIEAVMVVVIAETRKAMSTRTLAWLQLASAVTFVVIAAALLIGRTR